jgi:hypothetical protein
LTARTTLPAKTAGEMSEPSIDLMVGKSAREDMVGWRDAQRWELSAVTLQAKEKDGESARRPPKNREARANFARLEPHDEDV